MEELPASGRPVAVPSSGTMDQFTVLLQRTQARLAQHAIPDARFHYDFKQFVPNFRGSSDAIERAAQLPCYKSATTILVTPDNSLEQLRYRALKDGKSVLAITPKFRRGFVLLDPKNIAEDRFELASCLDGVERRGIGRYITLAQLQDEHIRVDLIATGALAVTDRGLLIGEAWTRGLDIAWVLLHDRQILSMATPSVAVVHPCSLVDSKTVPDIEFSMLAQLTCDFIVTPNETLQVGGAKRPTPELLSKCFADQSTMDTMPPIQELKGIKMMEEIMRGAGFAEETQKPNPSILNADEQMGIAMVEKMMRGYKA